MSERSIYPSGGAVARIATEPFDPFNVATWSSFIDQEDPRMISFDLRCELESAFDVHPFSAKCRQAVVKSLLLWASVAREQRERVEWNTATNIRLGQNIVQHLLDLTAELNGVNTDEIYAALQAEQHPYLKKMHEIMQSRRTDDGEWRGQYERASVATRRSTMCAISPAPYREPSARVPQRAPTALGESLARDDSHVAAPPPIYTKAVRTEGYVPTEYAAPVEASVPLQQSMPAISKEVDERNGEIAPHDRLALVKMEPPISTTAKSAKSASPTAVNAVAEVSTTASRPPPPSFAKAVKESKMNGVSPPTVAEKKAAHEHTAPAAPAPPVRPPSPPVTRETLVRKVIHPPPPPARDTSAKLAPAAAAAKGSAPPPAWKPSSAQRPSADVPAPRVASTKAPPSAPPPKKAAAPPAPKSPSFVPRKKQYVYSDSDETVSSNSIAEERFAVAPKKAASTTSAPPSATTSSTAIAGEADLLRYGADGPDDLLQLCMSELAADPDGVPAWFERRLAVTEKDRAVPLRVEATKPLSLEKIKMRMEPRVVKRLDELFEYLAADVSSELLPHNEAAAFLSTTDVDQLAAANLIRPAARSTKPDTVLAFSFVDGAEEEPTRRFLSWPCGSSRSAMEDGYEPHIPLHHISSYLKAVNAATGCAERWDVCFDQVELPPVVQERFVFTDAAGRRWCLTRLPMAHSVAAEVVHLLLSTLCGVPACALQSFTAASAVQMDVWVRTVRFYGPRRDVAQAREMFLAACRECGASLQPRKGGADGAYDFVGVHFDHAAHTVSMDPEMIRRIAAPRQSIATRDLERQYTQLLFSSSVLNVAVSKFYKLLRTVCWRLAKALENPDVLLEPESLPLDAFAQLEKWRRDVVKNVPRPVTEVTLPAMTLLIELSTENWFSVLIGEDTQETWNTGGSLEDMLGTKVACASITEAVKCFQPCIEKGAHVKIMILGGNCMGRNEMPIYKNESKEVIADCIRTHLVTRTFSFEVEYVGLSESKGNGSSSSSRKKA